MTHALLLLWITAIPLVFSPGPANISLATLGVAYGFRPGLPYLAGILIGTCVVLLSVALGATAVILSQPLLAKSLKAVAAAYILYLAWRIASAPVVREAEADLAAPSFLPGFLVAVANPKAFAALGAVYMQHRVLDGNLAIDAAIKTTALSLVIIASGVGWLLFGTLFSSIMRNPKSGRLMNLSFALLLVVSVGLALMT